jgi:hypothetical protein
LSSRIPRRYWAIYSTISANWILRGRPWGCPRALTIKYTSAHAEAITNWCSRLHTYPPLPLPQSSRDVQARQPAWIIECYSPPSTTPQSQGAIDKSQNMWFRGGIQPLRAFRIWGYECRVTSFFGICHNPTILPNSCYRAVPRPPSRKITLDLAKFPHILTPEPALFFMQQDPLG